MDERRILSNIDLADCGVLLMEYLRDTESEPVHTLGEWVEIIQAQRFGFEDHIDFEKRFMRPYADLMNAEYKKRGISERWFTYEVLTSRKTPLIRFAVEYAEYVVHSFSTKAITALRDSPSRSLTLFVHEWLDLLGLTQSGIRTVQECEQGLIIPLVDHLNRPDDPFLYFSYALVGEGAQQKIKMAFGSKKEQVISSCTKLIDYLYDQPNGTAAHTREEWAIKAGLDQKYSNYVESLVSDANTHAKGLIIEVHEAGEGSHGKLQLRIRSTEALPVSRDTFH